MGIPQTLKPVPRTWVLPSVPAAEWNQTDVAYPTDVCLHQLFEAQTARTPDAVALVFQNQQLTYRELDQRANQLANHLIELGVGPDSFVAVCAERSIEMVVALYGVLKAGAAYVPIAPDYPAQRVEFMLADAGAPVLLTQEHLCAQLPPQRGQVVRLDADWPVIAQQSTTAPAPAVTAADLAYMIYTSGSTGKPKGAMNAHRGIVNRLLWMQDTYRLTTADVVLQKTPFSFDVSVWEFFWPLLTGARLVVAKPGGHQDPQYLVDVIEQHGVTVLHFVPPMLQVFLESADRQRCRSLRHVICSGEALSYELQEKFFATLDAQLHNLYGPTEAAVDVTAWTCQRNSPLRIVPIGKPIANTQCHILDPQLQPVPIGEPGELHLGGIQVGRGYHHRPELTAEKFIPDPFRSEPDARLYKTGDLARYLPDGNIEYLGRLDHQVKIRGFRIELGEIEAALAAHSAVKQVVVVAREDQPGMKRLVAYLVGAEVPVKELRTWLLRTLPDYMVPAAFVWLKELPLSPNGKVDRKALPAPDSERPELPNEFVAPSTPAEHTLAAIWSEVLGVKSVGIHDSFFELGGDSIRAIQVLARAQAKGLPATLAQLLTTPTIYELARHDGAVTTVGAQLPAFGLVSTDDRQRLPAGLEDAYPATMLQVGMFYHNTLHAASAMYHDVFSFRIQFPFVEDKLRAAIQQFGTRHPTMRTSFDLAAYSEPLQLVHKSVVMPFTVEDLRVLPVPEQTQRLTEWIAAEKYRAFDRTVAPLLRVHVQLYSADQFQLIVSFHHAVLDGWSLAAMLTEVLQDYAALIKDAGVQTLAPNIPYRDYVALERQTVANAESRQFWANQLAGASVQMLPRWPKSLCRGGTEQVRGPEILFPAEVLDGLKRLAQSAGVPLKSVLQAAHYRVLSAVHGTSDVISGLVTNGRPEAIDGERMIGLFLNTVPLRLPMTGGTWRDLCRQVFAAERELIPHRRMPLAEIQKIAGGTALFETVFDFVHFHVYRNLQGYRDMGFLEGHYFEANNFTLYTTFMLDVTMTQLQMHFDYDPEQLCPSQIQALCDYYANILAAMAATPTARYEAFSPLPATEREHLLEEFNQTQADYPRAALVDTFFEAQARKTPDRIAVECAGKTLTYRELNDRADNLAAHLCERGVGPGELVALYVERSVDMLVALLGVLKSGAAYIPLDPIYPPDRLAFMIEDARPRVVLTDSGLLASLPPHTAEVVLIDRLPADPPPAKAQNRQPSDVAYVIYTSGSTGKPKGVSIPHRAVVNFLTDMQREPGLTMDDVLVAVTTLSFDIAGLELYLPIVTGARVVIATRDQAMDGAQLAQLLNDCGATVMQATPVTWRILLLAGWRSRKPIKVLCGGEALPTDLAEELVKCSPSVWNMYGPTETTIWSAVCRVRAGEPVRLGRPIANTQFYVVDERLQPAPTGVPGELLIGGDGVAVGYLNRPELTAEKFIANPFRPDARVYRTGDLVRYLPNGDLEFLGRSDRQVKIRGFRVELGEIQTLLQQHPQIRETVVVAREDTPGDKRIVAYFVPRTEAVPNVSVLRQFLETKLPGYMVPSTFVKLAALPLTPNGKIDQRALPKPVTARGDLATKYAAPRSDDERTIAGIWQEVLQVERVGLHDNFFDLGGHSLQLMRVYGKINAAFQSEIPIVTLFEHPTVTGLAQAVRGGPASAIIDDRVRNRAQRQREAASRRRELNTLQRTS
jgi:amino acid adenylation domain-containing protein